MLGLLEEALRGKSKLTKYQRFNIVKSKEQAETIVNNLKHEGIKAYYHFGYIIMSEIRE